MSVGLMAFLSSHPILLSAIGLVAFGLIGLFEFHIIRDRQLAKRAARQTWLFGGLLFVGRYVFFIVHQHL